MRRIALALFIMLLSVSPVLAQQTQTPPPPPPTPPAAPPAPTAPRVTVTVPPTSQRLGVTAPRPAAAAGQAPTVITTDRSGLTFSSSRMSPASWQNIKLDVVISDSLVPDVPSKKSVSMLILDGLSGQVRSSAGEGLINIDARPTIRPDGRLWVQLTIEYRPELSGQQLQQAGLNRTALFSESLSLLVTDGKPVMASQSADPRSDRKVTVEITASVIK